MGQTSEQEFSLQHGADEIFPTNSTLKVNGLRIAESNDPVGQNKRHQNRGRIVSCNPNKIARNIISMENERSFTNIIASVLNIPGALK